MITMSLLSYKHLFLWIFFIGLIHDSVERKISKSDLSDQIIEMDLLNELDNSSLEFLGYNGTTKMGMDDGLDVIQLDDPYRVLTVREEAVSEVIKLLRQYKRNFIFSFTLVQAVGNSGTLLLLRSGDKFRFQIRSDGRRKEIKLQYNFRSFVHLENFRFNLADGKVHKVDIAVTGKRISFFVYCIRIYRRLCPIVKVPPISDRYRLVLGQMHYRYNLLEGAFYEVKLTTPARGFVPKCSSLDADNSTCPSTVAVDHKMKMVSKREKRLTRRLAKIEPKVIEIEQSTCEKNCMDNVTKRLPGEVWKVDDCTTCRCTKGTIKCQTEKCSKPKCKYPFYKGNGCCPFYCNDNKCVYDSKFYEEGEAVSPKRCIRCECVKGTMVCAKQYIEGVCPKLNCIDSEPITIEGEHSPVCKPTGHCTHNNCHVFANCVNLANGTKCRCKDGFKGDGIDCTDINECSTYDWPRGHRCEDNAACVNTRGSYHCECKQGYSRLDRHSLCKDIDECLTSDEEKRHTCDKSQVCVNTEGTYRCECKEGDRLIRKDKCAGSIEEEVNDLTHFCTSPKMQEKIKHDCETGNILGCEVSYQMNSFPDCHRSYVCRDIHLVARNTTMKCLLLCGLMRHSQRKPLGDTWIKPFFTSYSTFTKSYIDQKTNSPVTNVPDELLEMQTYSYFYDLDVMSWANVTSTVNNCSSDLVRASYAKLPKGQMAENSKSFRNFANIENVMTCVNRTDIHPFDCPKIGKIFLAGTFQPDATDNDYCSRFFTKVNTFPPSVEKTRCYFACWLLDDVFNDPIIESNMLYRTNNYDVVFGAKGVDGTILKTSLIDVTFKTLRNTFLIFLLKSWQMFQTPDIRILMTDRRCYADKPKLCQLKESIEYDPRMLIPATVCKTPPWFKPEIEKSFGALPDGYSQKCAVRIACEFKKTPIKPWGHPTWCKHVDWIFNKSVEWLKHGADTDRETYLAIKFQGYKHYDRDYQYNHLIKEKPQPLRKIKTAFHQNMIKFSYPGVWFSILFVFKDCEDETKNRPSIAPYRDRCPNIDYLITPHGWTECLKGVITSKYKKLDATMTCHFFTKEDPKQVCLKLHYLTQPFVDHAKKYPSPGPYKITIVVTVQNGTKYTDFIPAVGGMVQVVYIKHFLMDHITNLKFVSIRSQQG